MLSDKIAVFNNGYVEQVGTPQEIYNRSSSEFVCDFIGDINKLGKEVITEINRQANGRLDAEKMPISGWSWFILHQGKAGFR